MEWRSYFLCCCVLVHYVKAIKFSTVTNTVRLEDNRGRISGFVDINADKTTDVLFIAGNNVSVYQWNREKERFHHHHLLDIDRVSNTVAVDLDGDGQVDLVTLTEQRKEEEREIRCFSMNVHWMMPVPGGPAVVRREFIADNVLSTPLILDVNGDHIPDLLTHNCINNTITIWTSHSSPSGGFQTHSISSPFTDYINSYYVDLTDDNLADVVMEGWGTNGRYLSFLQKNKACEKGFQYQSLAVPLPPPLSTANIASPLSFTDLDGDGITEAVGVTCTDINCHTVSVHILLPHSLSSSSSSSSSSASSTCGISETQLINFTHDVLHVGVTVASIPYCVLVTGCYHTVQSHTVSIPGVTASPSLISSYTPILGDINLDGFPDIILPVSSSSGNLMMMIARECPGNCNGSYITYDPHFISVSSGNITSVFFFDLWEDGVLDVLMTERREGDEEDSVIALRQHLQDDHAFLKILVLSGHCYHNCPSQQMPYGSVLPGVVVRFSTTDRMGRRKVGVRTLTSDPHQLPFTIFGLGQTPSLVERLEVGMDGGRGGAVSRQWTNLVPNSQIIIIPSPISQPLFWRLELYLTPGRLVYTTAGVLAALFIATAVLVLLLQTREKIQDTREKRMAKHKFHFNAM